MQVQLSVTYSDATTAGSCANASTITRTWTATDGCSNSINYNQVITIQDTTPPTITCPATQSQVAINGVDTLVKNYTAMATVTDNCSSVGNITVTQSPAVGSTITVGTNTITLTATDECGNSTNCSFSVTVTNGSSISWGTQPANTTIDCNQSSLPANTGTATATTTCTAGTLSVTYTDATTTGSCANASTITRTWTATDGCTNSVNFNQIITVQDTTPPTVTCPATQSQASTNGVDAILNDYTSLATVTDNCSSAGNITVTQSPAIGSTVTVGTTTVTLTATDECGNSSSCSFSTTIYSSVGIEETSFLNFSVYPNPSSGLLFINFSQKSNLSKTITVFNSLGKIVYVEEDIKAIKLKKIDLSENLNGVYYVQVKSGNQHYYKKIILM